MFHESSGLLDWNSQKWLAALLAVLLCSTLLLFCRSALHRTWRRYRLRARWARAHAAEGAAPALLRAHGYDVTGEQIDGGYTLVIDGQRHWVQLRADFLVVRGKYTYIAEVKSGRLAPRLQTSATRRQLLEYLLAYEVDGVLLVDPEKRRIHEVVFPVDSRREGQAGRTAFTAVLVGITLLFCVILMFMLR